MLIAANSYVFAAIGVQYFCCFLFLPSKRFLFLAWQGAAKLKIEN